MKIFNTIAASLIAIASVTVNAEHASRRLMLGGTPVANMKIHNAGFRESADSNSYRGGALVSSTFVLTTSLCIEIMFPNVVSVGTQYLNPWPYRASSSPSGFLKRMIRTLRLAWWQRLWAGVGLLIPMAHSLTYCWLSNWKCGALRTALRYTESIFRACAQVVFRMDTCEGDNGGRNRKRVTLSLVWPVIVTVAVQRDHRPIFRACRL